MNVEMTPRQWAGTALMCVAVAIVVIGQISTRIANPDLSETRLFVNYWWLWLTAFVTAFVGMWMAQEERT